MDVLVKTISLIAGLGLFGVLIYYFVLLQAPIKTVKDKKILLILSGVLMGPILYFHANALQIAVVVAVWLVLIGFSFSNRSLSTSTEKLIIFIGLVGYVLGMHVYS